MIAVDFLMSGSTRVFPDGIGWVFPDRTRWGWRVVIKSGGDLVGEIDHEKRNYA